MHPSRDTLPVINLSGAGGRVMPGVSWLLMTKEKKGKEMPKFDCRCGFVLNLVPYPNPYEHLLVPDASPEEAMM
jgi:hypothetical protein